MTETAPRYGYQDPATPDTREHYLTTLEATAPQPTLRIRIEHSRTIKDGWSYSTTVELSGVDATEAGMVAAHDILVDGLDRARWIGEIERDQRNVRDDARKEGAALSFNTAN
ncbi:MAG: hypothetical protein QM692_16045 [Thermomicrobiales bacterium]